MDATSEELAWLTAAEQQEAMTAGDVTALQLCELYLRRIRVISAAGCGHNVIEHLRIGQDQVG